MLYLRASEMIPTFTFTKNDLACFSFGGYWPFRSHEIMVGRALHIITPQVPLDMMNGRKKGCTIKGMGELAKIWRVLSMES